MPASHAWSRSSRIPTRRRPLSLEHLEDRLAPANLAITGITLVDGNNQAITAPVLGQQVFYRAAWSATAFTSAASYVVRYTVDGVSVDSATVTLGNGNNFTWYRGTTYASAGTHNVSITIDGGNSVAESNENDNTLTTTFAPVAPTDLPQKFIFPLDGTPNKDYSINNYVDVDPRAGSRADYRGGPFQYDGHDAIDVGPANFADQDAGIPIIAAADGVVSFVQDGYFDREVAWVNDTPNYVVINHGNGWTTSYLHQSANSIVVKAGDTVKQGQLLGFMGSSGISTGTHLHWSVYYRGANVETFFDPTSYWSNPPPYQGDAPPTVMESGITNYNPGTEMQEGPSKSNVFPTSQNWNLYYYYHVSNYRPDTTVRIEWYRPNGTLYTTYNQTPNYQQPSQWWWNFGTNWQSALGTWQVALIVDNVELDRQSFTVTSGTGVSEVSLKQGTTYLLDNRVTPLDYGSVAAGGSAVNKTYTISNLGSAPLTVSNLQMPAGFSLKPGSTVPSIIGAGASATFDVQLDTTKPGLKFGEISFTTNDSDEGQYSFLVKGTVTGALPGGSPVLTLPSPAVPYGYGKAPVVIDPAATLTDLGAVSWNGTTLRVEILTNDDTFDRLAIRNQGSRANQVGVSGSNVTYTPANGLPLVIGSFTGGQGTTPLVITFGANALQTSVEAVLKNLTYANSSLTPDTRPRFLGITFTDNTGLNSDLKFKRVTATPVPLNDAPVLTPGLAIDLPPLAEDQTPVGTSISAFTSGAIVDLDQLQQVGIAITGAVGSFGAWQYSLNNGVSWQLLGTVSTSAARLLGPTTLIRFVPGPDEFGTASLTYRAWDGTTGLLGGTIDLTNVAGGGVSAFSVASATSNVVVNSVNDLPTFTPGPNVTLDESSPLQTIPNWATNISAGPANENQTVLFLVTATDPQFFSVQPTISPSGTLTFQTAPNKLGATVVIVQIQDSGGGSSAEFSFQIITIPKNDAPVLTPFTKVILDSTPFTVASLLGGNVTDPDVGDKQGIAITGVTRTSGDWQYSLNGGVTWQTVSNASLKTARLLRATDMLRFNADTPFSGFGDLKFRAWDQTLGTAGGTGNLTGTGGTGGSSPFSVGEGLATIFLGKGVLGLDEDPVLINGGFVSQLLRGDVIDADFAATQGIAVIGGTQGSEGRWEFSLDGTNWQAMGPLTPSAARLLRISDSVRFVPAANWHGFFSITFHAWDQTSGVAGGLANLTNPALLGGSSSFSAETLNYQDLVVSVNDRPTLAGGNTILTPVLVGTTNPAGNPVSSLLNGSVDVDGDPIGVAITATSGPGKWQFSTNNGQTWQDVGNVSVNAARLIAAGSRLRFLPGAGYDSTSRAMITYRAWDGTSQAVDINVGSSFSSNEATASVASNTAPTLDTTPLVTLAPNTPTFVFDLLGTAVSDADPGALQGLAVIGTSGSGSWQYFLDGDTRWRPLVVLNEHSARLFRPQDMIRYLPNKGSLDGTLRYRAWDQAAGAAGLLDDPLADGVTSYSAEAETASVNAAPVLNPAKVAQFPTRVEGSGPGAGLQVRDLLGTAVTDNGKQSPRGIAIAAASGPANGHWEVSFNNGGAWEDLGDLSQGARLLRLLDRVRYVADVNFAGQVSIIYHAWDQSNGSAGDFASLAVLGGASPFSLRSAVSKLTVTNTNDRPALDAGAPIYLTSIAPGETTQGDAVSTLLAGASDPDPRSMLGVAVLATSGGGAWQFSTDGGQRWQVVGAVNAASALLLRASDQLRFIPDAGFRGQATVTFRAWDRTAGTAGKKFNSQGGAFSTNTASAQLAVNTAPMLDASKTQPLPTLLEDVINPDGATVEFLLGTSVDDQETGVVAGMAVVGVTGPGTWQFLLDGGTTWADFGSLSEDAARLLGPTDKVRFLPQPNVNGVELGSITYHAWDQTVWKAGDVLSITGVGGSTPFSPETAMSTVTVTAVNDRPVLAPAVATILPSLKPGTVNPAPSQVGVLTAGIVSDDADGTTSFGVAIVGQTGGNGGQWQYSLDGGLNWLVIGTLSPTSALLLGETDLIRFVPNPGFNGKATLTYAAWDHSTELLNKFHGDIVNTLDNDLADAFSLSTNVAYLPVNTAPTLRG